MALSQRMVAVDAVCQMSKVQGCLCQTEGEREMKVAIELSTDEIKELVAWYQVRQFMADRTDFDTATLRDRITERLLEAALATKGKEIRERDNDRMH